MPISDHVPSDVELLTRIKKHNNQNAEVELFKRYKGFIISHYRRLCKQLPGFYRKMALEDFTSEVYIYAYKKTIEYCDLDTIRDQKFKIIQIFGWYIRNLKNKYVREDIRSPHIINSSSLQVVSLCEDEANYATHAPFEDNTSNFTKPILEDLTFNRFLKQCSNRDRNILIDRDLAVRATGSPPTYIKMSEKFGISKTLLQQCVKRLFKEYKEFSF